MDAKSFLGKQTAEFIRAELTRNANLDDGIQQCHGIIFCCREVPVANAFTHLLNFSAEALLYFMVFGQFPERPCQRCRSCIIARKDHSPENRPVNVCTDCEL